MHSLIISPKHKCLILKSYEIQADLADNEWKFVSGPGMIYLISFVLSRPIINKSHARSISLTGLLKSKGEGVFGTYGSSIANVYIQCRSLAELWRNTLCDGYLVPTNHISEFAYHVVSSFRVWAWVRSNVTTITSSSSSCAYVRAYAYWRRVVVRLYHAMLACLLIHTYNFKAWYSVHTTCVYYVRIVIRISM